MNRFDENSSENRRILIKLALAHSLASWRGIRLENEVQNFVLKFFDG